MTDLKTPAVTTHDFRRALGRFASGLTVISGKEDGEPVGFTCQAFYSVSEDPPLVSFSVMRTSTSWPRIRRSGRFAVNLLAEDQHDLAATFARSGTDKWRDVNWNPSLLGNPLIYGGLCWIDCELYAEYEAGDHHIVIGRVNQVSPPSETAAGQPLIYYQGNFHNLR